MSLSRIFAGLLVIAGAGAMAMPVRAAVATGNIVETAKAAGSFNTLIAALTTTGACALRAKSGVAAGGAKPRRGTTARARAPRSAAARSAAARAAGAGGCAQRTRRALARRALAPQRRLARFAGPWRAKFRHAARARAHPARVRRRAHRLALQPRPARCSQLRSSPSPGF